MKEYIIEKTEIKNLEHKIKVKREYLEDIRCCKVLNEIIKDFTLGNIDLDDCGMLDLSINGLRKVSRDRITYVCDHNNKQNYVRLEANAGAFKVMIYIYREEILIFIYEDNYNFFSLKEV